MKISILLGFLFLSIIIFGQEEDRIVVKGSPKFLSKWSWANDSPITSLLNSGDKLTIKLATQSGIEVTTTFNNINKQLLILEEDENLVISCYEYDFDKDGNKEIVVIVSPDYAILNIYVFKYSKGLSELIGNFGGQFEIIFEQDLMILPFGSQGLASEYIYRSGAFFELIYHDPNLTGE